MDETWFIVERSANGRLVIFDQFTDGTQCLEAYEALDNEDAWIFALPS